MPKVEIAATAIRDLDRIRNPDLSRIRSHILDLQSNPRPHGVKKLDGPLHRIRVGDWRILYSINDRHEIVIILRVIRRSERTYRNL